MRPCRRTDLDDLHALWTDRAVRRFLWDDRAIAREEAADVVEASLRSFDESGYGQWVLAVAPDSATVGFCGLRPIDAGPEIELLYGLHPAHWGCGLATEASSAVLAYAFEELNLAAVAARVDAPNQASLRVLERLGMRFLGERPLDGRPTRHFEISRGEYRAAHGAGPLSSR